MLFSSNYGPFSQSFCSSSTDGTVCSGLKACLFRVRIFLSLLSTVFWHHYLFDIRSELGITRNRKIHAMRGHRPLLGTSPLNPTLTCPAVPVKTSWIRDRRSKVHSGEYLILRDRNEEHCIVDPKIKFQRKHDMWYVESALNHKRVTGYTLQLKKL